MSTEASELVVPQETGSEIALPNSVPSFMAAAAQSDDVKRQIAELQENTLPSFLKIPQKLTKQEIIDAAGGVGGVVIVPDMLPVCSPGGMFEMVPLYSYMEYILWNPLDLAGSDGAIVERTLDPNSEIAMLAMGPKETRERPHPKYPGNPKMNQRYVQHYNFIIAIPNMPIAILSFARGEFSTGRRLANLITQRAGAPPFGCRFQATPTERRNQAGQTWFGLQISNAEVAYVKDEKEYRFYESQNARYSKLHRDGLLTAAYDAEDVAHNNGTGGDGGVVDGTVVGSVVDDTI